jgi:hypothetical protein
MIDLAFGLTMTVLGRGYHTLLIDSANPFPSQAPSQAYPRKRDIGRQITQQSSFAIGTEQIE